MKPILFNTGMVQAILEGRKTVTRRVVKPKTKNSYIDEDFAGRPCEFIITGIDSKRFVKMCEPPYQVGDVLWVRETFADTWTPGDDTGYVYKVDGIPNSFPYWGNASTGKNEVWRPSLHMPKEAARIFLKVTDVRVERLHDIDNFWSSYEKEGMRNKNENISILMQEKFINTWNSTIKKKDIKLFGWDANPWVFVYEFERCENAF